MYHRLLCCLIVLIGLSAEAQASAAKINVRGKVTCKEKAIAGVVVALRGQKKQATTNDLGEYAIMNTGIAELPQIVPQSERINFCKGVLELSLRQASPIKVEIYDVKGSLVKKETSANAQAGIYRMNIAGISPASKLLVIHASIGSTKETYRYIPLQNGTYSANGPEAQNVIPVGKLAKITAVVDTLEAVKTGFDTKVILIGSLDTTVNIAIDSSGVDKGITVRLDQERQTIQGFGINACLMSGSIFPLNECFTLEGKDALGMSILRIGMETGGGLRGVPSGWEKARDTYGAKIIGSCWSAPAAWKDNNNENQGGHLLSSHYAEWAARIADFAKTNKLYAMSIANESDFASCASKGKPCTNDYASMVYTAREMVAFVKEAKKAFKSKAPDVKIIAPEASLWEHVWSTLSSTQKAAGYYNSSDPLGCGCWSNDINDAAELAKCAQKCINGDGYDYGHWLAKDTAAWNSFDILGVHEYEAQIAYPWPADVTNGKRTKEVWETEMSGVMWWPEMGPNLTIENGVAVARWIQSALTVGEASAWLYWWYGAPYYDSDDNEGLALIKGNSQKAKRYYTYGNYSRYIRPGQKVVNITGTDKLPAKVLLTASKDDAGKVVIVALNENASDQSIDIAISGGTAPASFTPIVTDKDNNWKEGTAVSVSGGVLKAALNKMSVTTFVSK
jgi:glucuronoarabinoxylan endo-1,4-beta-xylanase